MWRLTRQEQTVLILILLLLVTGWVVKAYRAAHPSTPSNLDQKAQPR